MTEIPLLLLSVAGLLSLAWVCCGSLVNKRWIKKPGSARELKSLQLLLGLLVKVFVLISLIILIPAPFPFGPLALLGALLLILHTLLSPPYFQSVTLGLVLILIYAYALSIIYQILY